ncbi:hypothetical protein JKA74_05395 [Marivirga sp. S37H4]|uniref:Mannose-6-phosphate isomerase type II C-terminal domain-containing protein n=1 Tax=Marivirga aurantiaca TaxID=2802615 RepID=A0A934WWN6_9BACT|nr:hypothetical protein [Marivirga aurantiaca]MBK6264464.1 hypothetical protein [Marivirga aurantiaca]
MVFQKVNKRNEVGIEKEVEAFRIHGLWDYFEQFFQHKPCQIRIIHIHRDSKSIFRNNQCKLLKILSGNPTIMITKAKIDAQKGDEFYIASLSSYQIITNSSSANILEVTVETVVMEDRLFEK